MNQLVRTVFRNSMFGLAAQLVMKLLSFGFSVYLVRVLGAADYGQYAAVLAFGSIFVFVADLGLSPFAVREIARSRDLPDGDQRTNVLYGNLLALRFILAIIASLLLIGAAWLTGRPPIMIGAIALGALGLVMYSVHGASDAVLSGFERIDISSQSKIVYQVLFVILGGAALSIGAGYYGLIGANLIGIAVMTLLCWSAARSMGATPGELVPSIWPMLLRAALPFGVVGFTLGLSYRFDSVLLNVFRGDAETGYYNAAYNLVFSAAILSNVINSAIYPSLARHAAQSANALPVVCGRALRYLMILSLPIAIGGWALADRLVPLLFGEHYLPAVTALQIVIWTLPFMFMSELLGYVAVVAQHENTVARSVMVSTGINVGFNLLLVPQFGLLGAAVMTVITEAVLVTQYIWILRATLRRLPWDRVLVRPLIAAVTMGLLVLALPEAPAVLRAVSGALAYGALLLAMGVVDREELLSLRELMSRRVQPAAA